MSQSEQRSNINWTVLFLCWLVASLSTTGSIFFSSVMEFTPCLLCWYQRISLFPLVLILGAGLVSFDRSVVKYSLPLAAAGWLVALYHTLLYSGIIPDNIQPCTQGVSCTEKYIDLFGFITIPMLSLLSFTTIIALLLILKRRMTK
ncbi:MAG: disulfide bond formation protein B [Desulfocapsa sp.]|uniref:Disulfide bond formation protein B n=1 Tax=Desulfotalea psychrophila TaxID=84980 RepID=A0ABS3ATQ8_9BACT|nr:disulfide bond formation protein B [Desulfocapsa sp.]MBN4068146.1 disulfide bond formation protein B [Desulfotalea psychrophila]